jgi:DNA primase
VIPPGFLQDLLARVDIVDVVGRHVELKKAGVNHKGLCPFHGEKTPSFIVSPTRQSYHCFGCGVHGDAIRFLVEHTGQSFPDAVRELAQQVGMTVPEGDFDPADRERAEAARAQRATLAEVLDKAAGFYRKQLKATPRAVEYLKHRGLTGAIAARFGLGYAPGGWRSLASAFARYDDPLLVEAGLVIVQGEDEAEQKRYDRFRDRVMFPIRSVKGEVIGFGGRVLDGGEPKYLNSPETPLFSKGRELYGLFEARQALRQKGCALVVEGYMDVVALAQWGFANAVATLGTACTAEHVHKLFRFTDSVVFAFDGDAAGRRAAARALEAALPHASDLRSVKFLFLPPEHDPDSFVREQGPAAFEAMVAQAVPLSRQLLEQAADDADLDTAEGRARFVAQARPLWQALPEGTFREQLLGEIAERARMAADALAQRWARNPRADHGERGQRGHRDGHDGGADRAERDAGGARADGSDAPPPRGSLPGRRPAPRRGTAAVAVRRPQDQAARILLQRSEWWLELGAQDHDALLASPGWHAELFRWLDRWLAEHGPLPWPGLREELQALPWGAQAAALVDAAELLVEPLLDDLRSAARQAHDAQHRAPHLELLGRS